MREATYTLPEMERYVKGREIQVAVLDDEPLGARVATRSSVALSAVAECATPPASPTALSAKAKLNANLVFMKESQTTFVSAGDH